MSDLSFNKIESLYIHIPFCDHICSYCDFKKIVCSDSLKAKYINALIKEINYKYDLGMYKDLKTIYIGGGTPSCLPNSLLESLLNELKKDIDLDKIKEFTIEVNPKDINKESIDFYKYLIDNFNISRISLGIQSFNDEKLKILNRNHSNADAKCAIELLHSLNFYNINVDLIYGLSMDTVELLKRDIDIINELDIKHVSLYSLILEEHTILYHKYLKGEFVEMDDDLSADIYYAITNYLKDLSYIHYEISNFAKAGYESIHNNITWDNLHYIGCGVCASYYIDDTRYTNINSIKMYIDYVNESKFDEIIDSIIQLDEDDMMYEEVMLALRRNKGINLDKFFNRFRKSIFEVYPNINKLIDDKLLIIDNNFIKIPEDKIYLENAILLKIFE